MYNRWIIMLIEVLIIKGFNGTSLNKLLILPVTKEIS